LKICHFQGLFAGRILMRIFVRGSVVEAAGGKSQRKIGGVRREEMTQL
jgi:hypothetical protein